MLLNEKDMTLKEKSIRGVRSIVNIFDADAIPFYVCYNKKDADFIKTLDDCIRICDDFINNINKFTNAEYYVGYLTKGKCFRYQINPSYKANRKYKDIPAFTTEVRQHMIDNHNFVYQENWEADDLVVSFKTQNPQFKGVLVSPDKDILNLFGKHLNPRKMAYKRTTRKESEVYFWGSMIIGDPGDNVKGLEGYGKVAAKEILESAETFEVSYHNAVLNSYIESLGEYEGIKEFTKNYLSLKLVDTVQLENIKLNEVNKIMSE